MERLTDKLILGICCAASAVAFSPDAETVALLLTAFALSTGVEAAGEAGARPRRGGQGARSGRAGRGSAGEKGGAVRSSAALRSRLLARLPWLLAATPCALALAQPRMAAFLSLAAYDLVRLGAERTEARLAREEAAGSGRAARGAQADPAGPGRPGTPGTAPVAAPLSQAAAATSVASLNRAPIFAGALLAVMVPWLAALSTRALAMGPLGLAVGLNAAAVLLAWRTTSTIAQRARNQLDRDRLSERAQHLAAQNRDLLDRRAYELRVATLEERARIAREIHDNVGHLLTRACLQVEALRVVHEGEARVQTDFADVGRTLNEALACVRASVHDLRDDAVDLELSMRELADETARDTGLAVEASVAAEHVPADVAACFTALVREAAANTLRHSDATRLSVRCLEHPALYQLLVVDNGTGAGTLGGGSAPDGATGGMGLASMRERVEALGGTFSAGPDAGGGFRVFASIPKRE